MATSNKVPIHQIQQQHGLNSQVQPPQQLVFSCGPHPTIVDPNPKTTTNFLDHRHFFHSHFHNHAAASQDDDSDDDDDDDVNNMDSIVNLAKGIHDDNDKNASYYKCDSVKPISAFGVKACYLNQSGNHKNGENNSSGGEGRDGRGGRDAYYTQYLNGVVGTSGGLSGQKDIVAVDDGYGFSERKEVGFLSEPGESLRAILSDPITGTLMDDAMILPCGHSFGSGGMQQVVMMKACYTCSGPASEDSIAPDLTLRVAVQAFRREDELHVNRTSNRRREKFDRDKGAYDDSTPTGHQRGRGVQFPFVVTDRVVIKGNKRTPQRFVGREAIVTTQCLNGWYVVKTVDNAESVKLQYRSLSKVAESNSSSKPSPIRTIANWL